MQRKRFIQAALAVAMACVTLLPQQSSASAASVTPNVTLGPDFIWGFSSVLCMNDPGNSTVNNTQMIIYNCFPDTTNMEWYFQQMDTVNGVTYWQIKNHKSGKCLTVQNASSANNAAIIQYTCNTGGNEEWSTNFFATDLGELDWYTIVSRKNPNMCITAQNDGTTNGTKLVQYTCGGAYDQLWTWFPPSQWKPEPIPLFF